MKKIGYILLLFICVLLLSACSDEQQPENIIKPFSFTNQEGEAFGNDHLNGKIWIADFIFTNCETVCLPMTANMADLQQKFKADGIQVEFVSFTVDPTVDSPEILKEYVDVFTDDLSNWHLLTGYSQEQIEVFAREQFQTIVQKPASSNQVIHSSNFYLIDQQGALINEYNYIDASYIDDMTKDIESLLK